MAIYIKRRSVSLRRFAGTRAVVWERRSREPWEGEKGLLSFSHGFRCVGEGKIVRKYADADPYSRVATQTLEVKGSLRAIASFEMSSRFLRRKPR